MVAKTSEALREAPLCYNAGLQRAARRMNSLYNSTIKPCGVDTEQLQILIQVRLRGDPTLATLSDYMITSRSTMKRVVAALVRTGLLLYTINSSDKRMRRVSLTEKGDAVIEEGAKLWIVTHRRLESLLGKTHTKDLRKTLDWISSEDFLDAFTVTRDV